MIQAGGVTMIGQRLQQIVDAGIRRVTVVIDPQRSSVRARLVRLLTLLPPVEVTFFDEREALGEAGALAEIDTGDDGVLLCFADPAIELDLEQLMSIHRERRLDVTLASHHEHHHVKPGELRLDGDTVVGYDEWARKDFLVCSGIAMFEARAMAVARALPRPYGVSDLLRAMLGSGCRVTNWLHGARWILDDDAERAVHGDAESIIRRQAG
ncbi:MAG TPA: hypothetical protein VFZ95_11740 [Steroidobacteraceae bacterium]